MTVSLLFNENMKRFIYLQVYLVIKVCCEDLSIDSGPVETGTIDTKRGVFNEIVDEVSKPQYFISQVPHINPRRRTQNDELISNELAIPCQGNSQQEGESVDYNEEVVSTAAAPTPYMEEFKLSELAENETFAKNSKWMYQGNKASEESEESKSTLIDYPFSASVQRKGSHYATGALISKSWVISAAGVFYHVRESLKLYRVRLGSVNCKKGGMLVPIKKIEIHPYYLYKKPNFDVCMLRLARKVVFTSFIRPIAISNIKGTVLSAKFMTTYWPRIVFNGVPLPASAMERILQSSMRVSTQRLIPSKNCTDTIRGLDEVLNESSLCLKPIVGHHSICMPDAGAPIIAEDGLWGVTSGWVSKLCPNIPAPTIFTRLASESVRSWLDMQLISPS